MQILLNARRWTTGRLSACAVLKTGSRLIAVVLALALLGVAAAQQTSKPSSDEIRSGFTQLNRSRLYYETAGAGQPVVLIHGNVGDRRHWDRQFAVLAKEFRVIRYDVRGYGRSSLPQEDAQYADHEDLAALLDHLGVRAAHLVGWSMGSGVAINFALAFPERTLSLTSVGSWVDGYSSAAAKALYADLANVGVMAREGGRAAALEAFMKADFFESTVRDAAAGEHFRSVAADYSFWAFSQRDPRRGLDPPAAQRISELRAPTLIMVGEHDIPACLEIAQELDESVRDSTRIVVPGAGHLLQMEKPEEFNEHLVGFLRRHRAELQ
jgi:pimeloyl-ACP methyl ester carboxylesterase